jgi:hypothetical protein
MTDKQAVEHFRDLVEDQRAWNGGQGSFEVPFAVAETVLAEALTRQAQVSDEGLREHRDFWLKSWVELEAAATALVAKIDALSEGECGPFAIKNSIANSPEMDVLRAALPSDPTDKSHAEIMAEASPADLDVIDGQVSDDAVTPAMIDAALDAWDSSEGDDRGRMWNAIERAMQASATNSEAVSELVEALEKCRDRFREYERQHQEKANRNQEEADKCIGGDTAAMASGYARDYRTKAVRNREMADMCDDALAKLGSRAPKGDTP